MEKKINLLPILCSIATLILLSLQAYWIIKYYNITKLNFEKEATLAFEDAFKKEFSLRADRIQGILKERLLDTNHFLITSALNKEQEVIYHIKEAKNPKGQYASFSNPRLNVMITKENKKMIVNKVADLFSEMLRNEDLNNHIIYYRTQELGKFMLTITHKLDFDTTNLRPILDRYLAEKSIFVDYQFYAKQKDSTTNKSKFKKSLLQKFPVITHALPTYKRSIGQNYIRVMFKDPYLYILANMRLILVSSILLVLLIAFCLYYLLKSLKNAKQLADIKNDFISNITHEFKTPIATALVAIDALADENTRKNEEKTQRYLSYAKNELMRISALTDKILKLSLYDKVNYILKKENIDLEAVIREIININALQKQNCSIIFENTTSIAYITADKEQFQHAVANIIENAIKYGNNPIKIRISCSIETNYFIIAIKDNGPGIDEAEIPLLFEKFYRGKQSKISAIKGYGLGLNYVKQIMQLHKGWYTLTSNINGTEIKLAWPL